MKLCTHQINSIKYLLFMIFKRTKIINNKKKFNKNIFIIIINIYNEIK